MRQRPNPTIDESGVPMGRDGGRPDIRLLLAAPRGFCAGVRRAIQAVRDALAIHGAPVFVRRAIVHNLQVVRELESEGAIFVEEVDDAPPGSVMVFSAHGVNPAVAGRAGERGLTSYDAVCPLVSKVHREVERHQRDGRVVILVGHEGHPEIDGTRGHASSGPTYLVANAEEVSGLDLPDDTPVAYAVQTTFAVDDATAIVDALKQRFSDLTGPPSSDICYATTNRQAAVGLIARRADAVIVAGAPFSSNARRLAEVAASYCPSVQLVAEADELAWERLPKGGCIGLTAAASTPESSVTSIIAALSSRYALHIEEVEAAHETVIFKPVAIG